MSRTKTVLIITDSHEQFSFAASLLRDDGYRVLFERDIRSGLKITRTEPPDLIISELAVFDIDGLQLCCRVRRDEILCSTPVLLVGDLSKQSLIVADGLRCGAVDYLQKPINQLQLFTSCCTIMGHEERDVTPMIDAEGFAIQVQRPSTNRILKYV